MKKALYIGIFDPITLGHYDLLERSALLVEELIIGVMANPILPTDLKLEDRIRLVKKAVKSIRNAKVVVYDGHLERFLNEYKVNLLIRGLRMMTDFESEMNVVHTNHQMNYGIDTVFLVTSETYSNYSSKEVRQIARAHGSIEVFLPECIVDDVKSIYA